MNDFSSPRKEGEVEELTTPAGSAPRWTSRRAYPMIGDLILGRLSKPSWARVPMVVETQGRLASLLDSGESLCRVAELVEVQPCFVHQS